MSFLDRVRDGIRRTARPVVAVVRRALETPPKPVHLQFQSIAAGPATGCQMMLPTPSELADAIVQYRYERPCADVVCQLVGRDDVCWDIGGHYGFYTLLMARLAVDGQVHTFEPAPKLAEAIRQSVSKSSLPHVEVHQMAIAGHQGELKLRVATESGDDSMGYLADYGGVNTPRSRDEYAKFEEISVPAVTLDTIEPTQPNFIKMDAEGAEAAILGSGLNLLDQAKPRLMIELHGVDRALRCANVLGKLGYVALQIADDGLMTPVLWIHSHDSEGLERAALALGRPLPVCFGDDHELHG